MTPQIIIPMSGFGERFRRAGYAVPKPLIEVEGKPIIAHVIDMFPGESDFIFICNQEHLDNPAYRMAAILEHYCPTGKIIGIAPHKLGPIHAVQQVADSVDPQRPTVVNYCDFTCFWDWRRFKKFVAENKCDGALPAYKGFHPHSLGTTNYAYIREDGGWVSDIQEKQPFTDNRMNEYASSGTYYFASGRIMLDAFAAVRAQDINVNGEYYVSLAYKPLLAAGKPVAVYELQHFMQWGTPEDVAEYNYWSDTFRRLIDPRMARRGPPLGTVVIPMAGMGQRFAKEGYTTTKPLIEVSGLPMVVQATRDLPAAQSYAFVLRRDMPGFEAIGETLKAEFPATRIVLVDKVTEGQACSAMLGLEGAQKAGAVAEPITFGACDNGALYDAEKLAALMRDPDIDVIVWGVRGYPNATRQPQMYGWVDAQDGKIKRISVKVPLADPAHDPIVPGTFIFRRAADAQRCVDRMIARNGRVNNEFYLDTCINDALELGLRCHLFIIDSYLNWGTPNDLRTFMYWQSCFHQWASHPYRLELDSRVLASAVAALEKQYAGQE